MHLLLNKVLCFLRKRSSLEPIFAILAIFLSFLVLFFFLLEMYPKPHFKIWTSPMVTPGAQVTFNCSASHQHMNFILYKDGSEIAFSDMSWPSPGASAAHFLIISVGFGDGGNYSCRYYDFAIWSEPSDSVELVVTGQEWGNANGYGTYPGQWVEGLSVGEEEVLLLKVTKKAFRIVPTTQ